MYILLLWSGQAAPGDRTCACCHGHWLSRTRWPGKGLPSEPCIGVNSSLSFLWPHNGPGLGTGVSPDKVSTGPQSQPPSFSSQLPAGEQQTEAGCCVKNKQATELDCWGAAGGQLASGHSKL